MTNEEMLKLIREDRPNQVIHEVVSFKEHEFKDRGVLYDVSVVMEAKIVPIVSERIIIQKMNINLPYPVEAYRKMINLFIGRNSNQYNQFITQYQNDHKCCPKCGSEIYNTTLMSTVFNENTPEEYKDTNKCTCIDCGDRHIVHDRVPKKS